MKIPIQNIYYLLCYSWNKLEEDKIVNVSQSDFRHMIDLFAKILMNGCIHLFKRGMDREYVLHSDDISGVKGKLDLSTTIKRNLKPMAKTHCEFDELDYDILHNQILRTTIGKIIRFPELDTSLLIELLPIYQRFHNVSEITIKSSDFSRVRLNRNNMFYDFLLKICNIIHESTVINERDGSLQFKDFLRNEKMMAHVFENFVRNFYGKEQSIYTSKIQYIDWAALPYDSDSTLDFLPKMKTDISLTSQSKKIIIDTKYYVDAFQKNYDKEKLISGNLYQIFAYVKNEQARNPDMEIEGMLLYPAAASEPDLSYIMTGHKVSVKTLNLDQEWRSIHNDLLSIIN